MGEGMDTDAAIMPFISSANIACGYHAGNLNIMKQTIELAIENKTAIGAHPGFNDKENFGRKDVQLSPIDLYQLVYDQVNLLQLLCRQAAVRLHHVKPHGALYNMAAKNKEMAQIIAQAVFDIDPSLILYGLSGSFLISEAKKINLKTASEVFADRTYQNDGSLTPRSQPNALIADVKQSLNQVLQLVQHQKVTTITGLTISLQAGTVCLHGDGEHAVEFATNIYDQLQQHQIHVKTI